MVEDDDVVLNCLCGSKIGNISQGTEAITNGMTAACSLLSEIRENPFKFLNMIRYYQIIKGERIY